ncbi:MAG TPA: hypothetical protein VMW08_00590 [Acidimicrobiales bacterium]|nr:hypothetical protein [Acidimicrobiales bacterium]
MNEATNAANARAAATITEALTDGILTAKVSGLFGLPALTLERADGQPLGRHGDHDVTGLTIDLHSVSLIGRVTTRNKDLRKAIRLGVAKIAAGGGKVAPVETITADEIARIDEARFTSIFAR